MNKYGSNFPLRLTWNVPNSDKERPLLRSNVSADTSVLPADATTIIIFGCCKAFKICFCLVLQKFFTSLSVRPGRQLAILAHLLPSFACISSTNLSSEENLHPLLHDPKKERLKNSITQHIWKYRGRHCWLAMHSTLDLRFHPQFIGCKALTAVSPLS